MISVPRCVAATALAVALVMITACRSVPADAPATPATVVAGDLVTLTDAAVARAGIQTTPAASAMRASMVDAPGLVALNETRTARIGSLVEGNVVEIFVQPGDQVSIGADLAHVHSHVAHDARAGYRRALADERRLVTELGFASDAEGRANRLYGDRAIALQDLQRAQANRISAAEALDMARAELERAAAELEHYGLRTAADGDHDQVPVRSPVAGTVLERLVTEGTAVTPGAPLFVVSDLSRLWALAEVDERHLATLRVGRAVTVRVAAHPDRTFRGTVAAIGATVNPATRRVTVRCDVPNTDGDLKPEMFATVELDQTDPLPVITIPAAAVQSVRGRTGVFVRRDTGGFAFTPVEVGSDRRGEVEIHAGLAAGAAVVTTGAFVLKSELLAASGDTTE